MDICEITKQTQKILSEFLPQSKLARGDIFVVGCSTSEVMGKKIGSVGSEEIARTLFDTIYDFCRSNGLYLASQCCEHLNRAIVIERELYEKNKYAYSRVNVVPQVHAGGSFAYTAYNSFADPVVVEEISADAGIDIGHTLIGMHLRPVAVPVRVSLDKIGEAPIVLARTRPKFIGGERAKYDGETR